MHFGSLFHALARSGVALAAAVLLVPVTTSVTNASTSRINAWTAPHVLTISDGSDLDTLNPHLSSFAPVANLSEMTMAWLIRWDEHNRPYPELATEVPAQRNGGISKDGLSITYYIRKNVRCSESRWANSLVMPRRS